MAPDQRGEVDDVIVVGIHAVQPDLANSLLHVDGVPVHDRIESETEGAKLLFLPLLKRTPDFAAFAMMDTPAEAVTQFCVVELGQDGRDLTLIMAADTIAGYIQGLLKGIEFKQTAYALDRDSRRAALDQFLIKAAREPSSETEEEARLAA